jgi:DHA2 family multidrug resistance protein
MAVRHLVFPNPLIHIGFLGQWNIVILGILLAFFRLVMLAAVVVVPNFLGTVQNYKALQTGTTLLWIALPQVAFSLLAMWLLRRVDPRMILGTGFFVVGLGCVINSRLTSVWAGQTFSLSLLLLAFGFAFAFNGLVAGIILQAFNTGLIKRPVEALTYGGYFQTIRLFGGQLGTALILHLIPLREQIHSNVLVDYANAGNSLALQRFSLLRSGMSIHSDTVTASSQAAALLGLQIRQQSFTLAIADAFHLLAWAALIALLFIALLRREPVQYSDVLQPAKAS